MAPSIVQNVSTSGAFLVLLEGLSIEREDRIRLPQFVRIILLFLDVVNSAAIEPKNRGDENADSESAGALTS